MRSTGNYDPLGIKLLLTRLRVGYSHFSEHKFRHDFADSLNPLCCCLLEIESTLHFLRRCKIYTTSRRYLLTELKNINDAIMSLNENEISKIHVIMHGNKNFDNNINYRYTYCNYQIHQRLKVWSTSFFTIIKTILIPSSIPFLNVLFKCYVVLQLEGCFYDDWKTRFLPRLILNWLTFSSRVTAR